MKTYPINIFTNNYECKNNTKYTRLNFGNRISQKEIKEIGNNYINKSKQAKNRDEFYNIAKSYLKDGIIPIFNKNEGHKDNSNLLRQEIVNMIYADIELSFEPTLMLAQEDIKHVGLKAERKHFANIVKTVNKLIDKWKENNKI